MLALPAIARIPRTDRSQRIKKIPAISRNGEGSAPISQRITAKIITSQSVILLPARTRRGTCKDATGPYPINQRKRRSKRITVIILYYYLMLSKVHYERSKN